MSSIGKDVSLMDTMSIAAMSVEMHQQENVADLGTAVLKMAMDSQTDVMAGMIEDMASLNTADMTGVGGLVDIMA